MLLFDFFTAGAPSAAGAAAGVASFAGAAAATGAVTVTGLAGTGVAAVCANDAVEAANSVAAIKVIFNKLSP